MVINERDEGGFYSLSLGNEITFNDGLYCLKNQRIGSGRRPREQTLKRVDILHGVSRRASRGDSAHDDVLVNLKA